MVELNEKSGRGWIHRAVRKIEADFNRSADTHLLHVPLPSLPRIALYPLLLMIFGINDLSRIVIVIIGVIFPVVFNAYMGAKQTPRLLIDAANVFGYSSNQLFLHVIFPASLPYLIAGVRTGVTLGMIMVVVAEFFGGSSGLGQNIAQTAQLYKTAELYAWVLYTSLFALVLVKGADLFERWAMRWA
jgi:ABC-type nitrate/sulfonate/bicarbonate transport system permease component